MTVENPLKLRMVTVSEEAIIQTMKFLWSRLKIVVEPTGTLGTAALLNHQIEARGKRISVIISGGNVDPDVKS
ncbi:MAG: hypothetical protein Kow0049_28890 [Stanieria sp.]